MHQCFWYFPGALHRHWPCKGLMWSFCKWHFLSYPSIVCFPSTFQLANITWCVKSRLHWEKQTKTEGNKKTLQNIYQFGSFISLLKMCRVFPWISESVVQHFLLQKKKNQCDFWNGAAIFNPLPVIESSLKWLLGVECFVFIFVLRISVNGTNSWGSLFSF